MSLPAEELEQLAPDIVILDEFHRCGAECWGRGVARLLKACPEAKILGLSATNVRYLDNQRDMAQELFDGNIASEMPLGEAIVRGILPAPKYVTTVFKYQQDLERYQRRIDAFSAAGIRDANQKYLDALRRALDKAEGLDQIFARHITEKAGKYIVFCANVEHMREMMSLVPDWFAGVDSAPHCYAVYSDNPETSRAFAGFKKDESGHLKLLFCIDMLNEGIHVEGISGVILFRPTVSPIIYKQQIGRALTAGGKNTPLILDVVNNVENLFSINALKEEVAAAVQFLRANGEAAEIVTEEFEVVEQVKDCRILFEQLQNNLSSTWEQYFHAASAYAAEHGDLNVPKRYVTPGGLSLGVWITTQRKVRAGRQSGCLTEQQIGRLDSIGMIWENRLETAWERNYAYAEAYFKTYGNLLVPAKYETPDGFRLGAWISNLRQQRANSEKRNLLTPERIARLDAIGMEWDVISFKWETHYLAAVRYYQEHGNLMVPAKYETEDGFKLGAWITSQRMARMGVRSYRPLTEDQIRRLDQIGMFWGNSHEKRWAHAYRAAERYYRLNGNLDVPTAYQSPDGVALGKWVRRQRYARQNPQKSNSNLTSERIRMLDQIGMRW